jgi:DNA-binding transcriptional LysR family regulator
LVEAGLGISIEPTSSIREQDLTVKIIELTEIPQKAELTMLWSAKLELEYPQLFELLSK